MSTMNISLEIYDILERKLGRDDAMAVAKSIEASMSYVEERSREIAVQRKLEVKEELKQELRDELATKADIARLEGKMNVRFVATIAVILLVNKDALMLMAHLLGLIK